MGRHASGPPPDPAAEWRSIWHVTRVNSQGQEVEIALWLRIAIRVSVNGALGLVLVGALLFSSYQLLDSSPNGALTSIELIAVPFASGVVAGEIRRRRRHVFSASVQTTYIIVLVCLAAGVPVLLHFSYDVAALIVAFVFGLPALSLRLDDFPTADPAA
jgi:hypothetical protein